MSLKNTQLKTVPQNHLYKIILVGIKRVYTAPKNRVITHLAKQKSRRHQNFADYTERGTTFTRSRFI